tara:strand:+ start:1483 stop:2829 length:1347 start_codon:yes stop_codon:yes gene_type:complete
MAIVLRQTKGSELTFAEVDGNFSSLFYSASLQGTYLNFYTWEDNLSQSFDLSVIPGFGGVTVQDNGVTVVPIATGLNFIGSGVTVTQVGSNQANIEFTGGGDTYTLVAGAKSGTSVPLNLNAGVGADSTVNLTEGTGITLTQTSATEITIDASGADTFTNSTPTPLNFPGNSPFDTISSGTTFSAKTFTEMMNLMLYPTLFPSLSNPSSGLTLTTTPNIAGTLREIGTVYDAISTTINLFSTFNRGSINPAYGTNGFRSGLPNAYNYTGPGSVPSPQPSTSTSNNTSTSATYTIIQGNQSWQSSVSYDQGQQPLDSIGDNFSSALPAGTTNNNTKNLTGVYPVFATTSNISTLTKQGLQFMSLLVEVSMVTEAGSTDKQTVEIPNAFNTITGLQQFNTLSNVWDNIQLSSFTLNSSITRTIQGISGIPYNRYTHNGAIIGARQLRFLV